MHNASVWKNGGSYKYLKNHKKDLKNTSNFNFLLHSIEVKGDK